MNKLILVLAIAIMLGGCAGRSYTETVYYIDDAGEVRTKEITKTRPAPKPLKGGDTSCTICGFDRL